MSMKIGNDFGHKDVLQISNDDFQVLEEYLKQIGVRIRKTMIRDGIAYIQADNPYKTFIGREERPYADEAMTPFCTSVYKR